MIVKDIGDFGQASCSIYACQLFWLSEHVLCRSLTKQPQIHIGIHILRVPPIIRSKIEYGNHYRHQTWSLGSSRDNDRDFDKNVTAESETIKSCRGWVWDNKELSQLILRQLRTVQRASIREEALCSVGGTHIYIWKQRCNVNISSLSESEGHKASYTPSFTRLW